MKEEAMGHLLCEMAVMV